MNNFVLKLAADLQAGLDGIAEAFAYNFRFKIHATVGDYEAAFQSGKKLPNRVINGVVTLDDSEIIPIKNLNNYTLSLSFEVIVPIDLKDECRNCLMTLASQRVGTTTQYDDSYTYVFNMDIPADGDAGIRTNVGESIDLSTTLYYNFLGNSVVSNNCKWSIDGEEILYFEATFTRTKTTETSTYENATEMYSLAPQQGFAVSIVAPYLKTPTLKGLVSESMLGINQQHTLRYDDGNIVIERAVLLSEFVSNYQPGRGVTLNMGFLPALED